MKSQLRRKDLKRPDEFVSYGQQALRWVQEHRQVVLGVGLAVLVLLLIVGGIVNYRRNAQAQANADLAEALTVYRAGNFAEAAKRLGEVHERWANRGPGRLAAVLGGQAQLRAKQWETAAVQLDSLAKHADGLPKELVQSVEVGAGYAYEGSGKTEEAARAFEQAEQTGGPYSAVARYEQLRLALRRGDRGRAETVLEALQRESPDSAETRRAKALLRVP